MTTLKDVAEMAGVSVSLVSYVLNGKKKVRPETMKRIEDAIEALDYCPNILASSLKTTLTKSVGVVVSEIENPFCMELVKYMEKELSAYGYFMTLCNSDNDDEREKKCIRGMLSRNIDGMVLIGTGKSDLTNYRKLKMPLVCLDRVSDEDFFTICVDHVLGGKTATEHLLSKGRKRIIFLGNPQYAFSNDRYEGYKQAMKKAGIYNERQVIELETLNMEEAEEKITERIKSGAEFDGVFSCLDSLACGVMKALLKNGKKIPEDVGIVGYDDIPVASMCYPELTTLSQPSEQMAKLAVEYLMEFIDGKTYEKKQVVLNPVLVERQTS